MCGEEESDDTEDECECGTECMSDTIDVSSTEAALKGRIGMLESLVHARHNELVRLRASSHEKLACVGKELARLQQCSIEQKELALHETEREQAAVSAATHIQKVISAKTYEDDVAYRTAALNKICEQRRVIEEQKCVIDEQYRLIGHLNTEVSKLRSSHKKSKGSTPTVSRGGGIHKRVRGSSSGSH